MDASPPFQFLIDKNQSVRQLRAILEARGHRVTPVQVGFKDPAILVATEEEGSIIVTADIWFFTELFRFPKNHWRRYQRAGVILVPGEWEAARSRIIEYLPVIEAVHKMCQSRADHRLGINLATTEVRIK